MEEEKQYLHSASLDGRHTIGFNFDLYHKYCQQAKVRVPHAVHVHVNKNYSLHDNMYIYIYIIQFMCSSEVVRVSVNLHGNRHCVHQSCFVLFVCLSFFPHKQEMLYRRLQKLQQLVTCTSQLDKAKPQKKEEVGLCLCDCVVLAAS